MKGGKPEGATSDESTDSINFPRKTGDTRKKTGFWLEGFAGPYYSLNDAGVDLALASPDGGQPPLAPKSTEAHFQTAHTRRFDKDQVAQNALAIVDGLIITGQNPAPSVAGAEALLKAINSPQSA